MKMVLLALSLAGLLSGCTEPPQVGIAGKAAALAKTIAAEQDHVTVAELSDWIIKDQRDYELIDIREAADFAAGHIRDARHVPLSALLSDASLATLPQGRRLVIYSNGTAHAAQAALLLRLVDRDAYALLGGFNYWQAYLNDPQSAGVAEMDPVARARYQAVACFFAGDYVADAGLQVKGTAAQARPDETGSAGADELGLGLGLGLGSADVLDVAPGGESAPPPQSADPLGLGLDLGLGGEAAKSLREDAQPEPKRNTGRLLIKAEC
ncbi:MAG: rhodanese-like domain-containing protein [Chromatiaceae bacterium]|nr:rhodanese-like domain-containing protein [Chromatiaceae bacterium]